MVIISKCSHPGVSVPGPAPLLSSLQRAVTPEEVGWGGPLDVRALASWLTLHLLYAT